MVLLRGEGSWLYLSPICKGPLGAAKSHDQSAKSHHYLSPRGTSRAIDGLPRRLRICQRFAHGEEIRPRPGRGTLWEPAPKRVAYRSVLRSIPKTTDVDQRSSWSVRSRVQSSVWQSLATRKLHPDAIDYATRVHTSELVPLHIDQ